MFAISRAHGGSRMRSGSWKPPQVGRRESTHGALGPKTQMSRVLSYGTSEMASACGYEEGPKLSVEFVKTFREQTHTLSGIGSPGLRGADFSLNILLKSQRSRGLWAPGRSHPGLTAKHPAAGAI